MSGNERYWNGAGDGQCLAIKKSDGERCQNGVYGTNRCCGTHKNAEGVTLAPETDDREYYYCTYCGFQPAAYQGEVEICGSCQVEYPGDLETYRLIEPEDDFTVNPNGTLELLVTDN